MHEMDAYLDQIMDVASLARKDRGRVRNELADHMQEICDLGKKNGVPEKEIMAMVRKEFGDPNELGKMIARAKGRFRTYLKKQMMWVPVQLAIAVVLAVTINFTMFSFFRAATDAVAPIVPKGSHIAVSRLARDFAVGDIIVYRDAKRKILGKVKSVDADGNVLVSSKVREDRLVSKKDIVGRAFFMYSLVKTSSATE